MMSVAMISLTALLAACTSGRELAVAGQTPSSSRISHQQLVFNQGESMAFKPQEGPTSWYHEDWTTASGERYKPDNLTAAHQTLPLGTIIRVTRIDTGKTVTVRVNDRGPFKKGRILDLSRGAAKQLDMMTCGVTRCRIEVVQYPANS